MGERSKNWWEKTIENGTFNRIITYGYTILYDIIWPTGYDKTVLSLGLFKTGG
jgi:hypothetical protein